MDSKVLQEAVINGKFDEVKAIVEQHPNLVNQDDEYEWRPIFHAGLRKQYDIVKYLIDQGADLSAHDGYVLHFAGEVPDNKDIVSLLTEYGGLDAHTEPSSDLARQFICAVFLANAKRAKALLLDHPELVKERYARGDLALHHAARNGDLEIVKILVESGADVDALSDNKHFPLYCAAGHGHVETTLFLIANGADLEARLEDGNTIVEWINHYADNDKRMKACLDVLKH